MPKTNVSTEEMYKYYMENNVSLRDVGKKFGINANSVRKRFVKSSLVCKSRNATRQCHITKADLYKLHHVENKICSEIAEIYNVATSTISNKLREFGIAKTIAESRASREDNYTLWTPEIKKRAKKLLEQGMQIKEVAAKLNLSEGVLQPYNKKYLGVPIRFWEDKDEEAVRDALEEYRDYDKVAELFGIERQKIYTKNSKFWKIDCSDNSNLFGTSTVGEDGFKYQSRIEAEFANRLFRVGIDYGRQVRVCEERRWRCDFIVDNLWIEVDGLGSFRSETGDDCYDTNPKIKYMRDNNFNLMIVNKKNFEDCLEKLGAPWQIEIDGIVLQEIPYKVANEFCANYHYLGGAPSGDKIRLGFYKGKRLCGIVTFGPGANKSLIGAVTDVSVRGLELTRLCALPAMAKNFASHIVGRSLRHIKNDCDLVVSFADPNQDHCGIVYQAANFIYTGKSNKDYRYQLPNGRIVHKSVFRCRDGLTEKQLADGAGAKKIKVSGKHRYVFIQKRLRKKVLKNFKYPILDYPKC